MTGSRCEDRHFSVLNQEAEKVGEQAERNMLTQRDRDPVGPSLLLLIIIVIIWVIIPSMLTALLDQNSFGRFMALGS